jgi:hypothetical protein
LPGGSRGLGDVYKRQVLYPYIMNESLIYSKFKFTSIGLSDL